MKRLLTPLLILLCVCCLPLSVCGAVTSTPEPTAGNAVYIAGNPAMYPLEFYNEQSERYEGILPRLYESISEQTGLEFSYVCADTEDQRQRLAENGQVEIVSAYHRGDIAAAQEIALFSYTADGKEYTVCVGFTHIIDPAVADAVESALLRADKDAWMAAAMALKRQTPRTSLIVVLAAAVFVLLCAVVALIVYTAKKRRRKKEQHHTRMTDAVTGIGNAAYFEDAYAQHVSEAMRELYYVAYIAVDIEKIETYFGVPQAEELQRYAATTVTAAMRDTDFCARIDNGVFAACCMYPDSRRAVETATELMNTLNAYSESYARDSGVVFRCGLYPLEKRHIPCEAAIYNARQGYLSAVNDKQPVRLCDKAVLERVSLKSRLQKKISSAIENEEFHIYLQFVYDAKAGRFCGAEILSRWHDREEGVLSPANYIEDMKLAGMIDRLDLYIFDNTCRILSGWSGTPYGDLYLSCNFTRTTLSSATFLTTFEEILSRYDFDRSRLIIELTEDFLADNQAAYENIRTIKSFGCRVALDDFGSGYTSVGDLCDYPIDIIKIDRHIVTKATSSRGHAVLVGLVRMAHALGIEVLCEGVESEEESCRVTDADCDYIQGFLYSRVLPMENAMDFLHKKQ